MARMFNPPHPGGILKEELDALHLSAQEFAERIGMDASMLVRILNEQSPVTPELAVKLPRVICGPSTVAWLAMQADYDSWAAERRAVAGGTSTAP